MRLLTAILSYNRYYPLKNTIDSYRVYGPDSDLLIVDDGSTDARVTDLLNEEERKERTIAIRGTREETRGHGGLYANMNAAIEHAIMHDYSHIFFIQDDVQFMWNDPDFLKRVKTVFEKCPDAAMVSPLFHKGILKTSMKTRLHQSDKAQCWHLHPYGMADIGISPVSLFKESSWRFGGNEGESASYWYDLGKRLYFLHAPTLAWIPWPEVQFTSKKMGRERRPQKKLFLKPLTNEQIATLKSAPLSEIPYHEDYCFPWGWRCFSPYWFTRGRKEYRRLLWQWIKDGHGWPKIVSKS